TVRGASIALLISIASFLAPAAARAQPNPHLMLVSQSSWVTPGGPFELRLRVDPPAAMADLDLALVAYQRVSSRSGFPRTLDDQCLGSVLAVYSAPAVSLPQEPPGTIGAAVPSARDAARCAKPVVVRTPEPLQGVAANPEPAGQAALSTLRRVVERRQLISGTYVPVSLSGLVDNGLAVEANVQVLHGRDV